MPRILGVDIPKEKQVKIALTYIFGLGRASAANILKKAQIPPHKLAKDLTDEEVSRITSIIQSDYKSEGQLKREIAFNIRRLMEIGCFRGWRHKKGLPVRGQRTRTNARTRKGPRRGVRPIIKKES